jgi:hypothetical protein
MRAVCNVVGIILLGVAVIYFILPADQLPIFLPGYEPDLARVHVKHGVVSGVAGLVVLAIGWFLARR